MKIFPRDQVVTAFKRRGFHGRAAEAALLVLTTGKPKADAARAAQVDPSAVTRLLSKLTITYQCPCCDTTVQEIDLDS